jgi:hypothetical protein
MDDLLIAPARRLPGEGFAVAGSSYPEGILWPANVRRIDHVSPSQHGEFYWEDSEILVVGSTDDVIEILQDLPEQKRELIAARARERLMRELRYEKNDTGTANTKAGALVSQPPFLVWATNSPGTPFRRFSVFQVATDLLISSCGSDWWNLFIIPYCLPRKVARVVGVKRPGSRG